MKIDQAAEARPSLLIRHDQVRCFSFFCRLHCVGSRVGVWTLDFHIPHLCHFHAILRGLGPYMGTLTLEHPKTTAAAASISCSHTENAAYRSLSPQTHAYFLSSNSYPCHFLRSPLLVPRLQRARLIRWLKLSWVQSYLHQVREEREG